MAFSLSSTAFQNGTAIPVKHTCDGADVSPPLAWSGGPPGAAALAPIADDPHAPRGTGGDWGPFNPPATATGPPGNVAQTEVVPGPCGGGGVAGRGPKK